MFLIAAATDWLDGWLARRWQQESAFGAFLDPVADKLMVVTALVLLVDAFNSVLVTLSAVVIIGREIVVSALREWMSEIGQRAHVSVSWLGKVKTAAQMLAITVCLALPIEQTLLHPGLWILVIAALLTLWSMGILTSRQRGLTSVHRPPIENQINTRTRCIVVLVEDRTFV